MAVQLLVTDENLVVQGDPLADWANLDVTSKFNEPASGSVDLPAWPDVMAQLQPGARLLVIRDGEVWCAGPMEVPQDYSWGVDESGEPDPGKVTINFSDDMAVVAGRITWPDPTLPWASQPSSTPRTIASTNAETIIRQLVDESCGPRALAERQIPHLVLTAAAGAGTTTSVTTRLEPLLDVCRSVAIAGGGLGFRTRQQGGQILFETYKPADLTKTARFSRGLGNLRGVTFKQEAPTVTHALVSGSDPDTGAARAYVEVADTAAAAAWWRVEQHVDGNVADDATGELTAAGTEQLAGGSAPVEMATVTVDTDELRAGRDFGLGDRVTVQLPTGLEVADVVRSIHLQASADEGEQVTTVVGSPDATTDPATVRLIRDLGRRLGRLEAR